jgi:hypothetical protein
VVDQAIRFEVQPALREDGTTGVPYRLVFSLRTCWKKPPLRLVLAYLHEVENVAYYQIVDRS